MYMSWLDSIWTDPPEPYSYAERHVGISLAAYLGRDEVVAFHCINDWEALLEKLDILEAHFKLDTRVIVARNSILRAVKAYKRNAPVTYRLPINLAVPGFVTEGIKDFVDRNLRSRSVDVLKNNLIDRSDRRALHIIARHVGSEVLYKLLAGEGPKFDEVLGHYEGLWAELFNHYCNVGEMPYGTAKARTGDPDEWLFNRLEGIFS